MRRTEQGYVKAVLGLHLPLVFFARLVIIFDISALGGQI